MKANKYRAVRTVVDGISFASKREAKRYSELRLLEQGGVISDLELQVCYPCEVNGQLVCRYYADFRYREGGRVVVEDVKVNPTATPVYKLKKKLVRALYGLEILET